MKKLILLSSICLFSTYNFFGCTATGTITPNPTPTVSASITPTSTATPTISPSITPTPLPSDLPSPTSSPTSSPSQDYNYLIEKARAIPEIVACLNKGTNSSEEINGSVEVTGICFVKGNTKRVIFSAKPKCAEGQLCPQYIKLVATVEFDCEDNVTKTQCN